MDTVEVLGRAYRPRVIDVALRRALTAAGAVVVEGARASGKTMTAMHAAGSYAFIDSIRRGLGAHVGHLPAGGFPVYIDGGWAVYGGTSLSSPTWGAILADINSTATCGDGAGFISPKLYAIASIPSEYAASFNDVTIGNNDNFGAADGLYPATTGYDMASGLGSPRVTGATGSNGLAYYLCATPAVTPPTITGLSPGALSSSDVCGGTTLTITGNHFETPAGGKDVAGVTWRSDLLGS